MSSFQTGLSTNPNHKHSNSSLHRRNDSGELDVFEAARYFSSDSHAGEFEPRRLQRSTARMSLDVPGFRNPVHPAGNDLAVDQYKPPSLKGMMAGHGAKYKQPSSPGARLASFLNSLFSQTASKKKKKSKPSSNAASGGGKDADEDSVRRKRRSSISHFVGIASGGSSRADPAAITPTKSYKEVRNLPELHNVPETDKRAGEDQKSRLSNGSTAAGNLGIIGKLGFSGRNSADRKFSDADDGADTDSSSDLFDLPSHELDFYSNGLPVYGTTNIDRIRIVAPISTTATVK